MPVLSRGRRGWRKSEEWIYEEEIRVLEGGDKAVVKRGRSERVKGRRE